MSKQRGAKREEHDQRLDWAWAAGFIDGRGTLVYERTTPTLRVSSKDKTVLLMLRQTLGAGTIHQYKRTTPAGDPTETHTFYLAGKQVLPPILKNLLPYFLVKGAQAQEIVSAPWGGSP